MRTSGGKLAYSKNKSIKESVKDLHTKNNLGCGEFQH